MKFFRKMGLAVLGLFVLATLAYALTTPPTYSNRQVPFQTSTHFRAKINFNDGNITTGVKIGSIPDKAFITNQFCHVTTTFNASTTNQLLVGTTQGGADWLAGGTTANVNCNLASATYQPLSNSAGMGLNVTNGATPTGSSGGWDIWIKYSTAGVAAATTGVVTWIIEYVPNDDL